MDNSLSLAVQGRVQQGTNMTIVPELIYPLLEKEFFTIGDSLSTSGTWQAKLATLAGAIFDNTKNILAGSPLSAGGTKSGGVNVNCGQWRARNLESYNPEIIIIQNENDLNQIDYKGTITDSSFMLSNIITHPFTFASEADLNTWIENGSFAAYLASFATVDRKIGSGIRFPYLSGGATLHLEYIFDSDMLSNWEFIDVWKHQFFVGLYKIYKGLLEYLISTFPAALIYWMIPTRYGFDYTDPAYLNQDGSVNVAAYEATDDYLKYKELVAVQKEVCNYYNINYIDIDSLSAITVSNVETYYYVNNVHPKPAGYEEWGIATNRIVQEQSLKTATIPSRYLSLTNSLIAKYTKALTDNQKIKLNDLVLSLDSEVLKKMKKIYLPVLADNLNESFVNIADTALPTDVVPNSLYYALRSNGIYNAVPTNLQAATLNVSLSDLTTHDISILFFNTENFEAGVDAFAAFGSNILQISHQWFTILQEFRGVTPASNFRVANQDVYQKLPLYSSYLLSIGYKNTLKGYSFTGGTQMKAYCPTERVLTLTSEITNLAISGTINLAGYFSAYMTKPHSLIMIGQGLTNAEIQSIKPAIDQFMSAMGVTVEG